MLVIVSPNIRDGDFFALSYGLRSDSYTVINRPEQVKGTPDWFVVVLGNEQLDANPTVSALLEAGCKQLSPDDLWRQRDAS